MTAPLTDDQRDRLAEDLTVAIMRHYGYTDADLADAAEVHPGRVCSDKCERADGVSIHPVYDVLAETASLMVEVVSPRVAAMLAEQRVRTRRWMESYRNLNDAVPAMLAEARSEGAAEALDRHSLEHESLQQRVDTAEDDVRRAVIEYCRMSESLVNDSSAPVAIGLARAYKDIADRLEGSRERKQACRGEGTAPDEQS